MIAAMNALSPKIARAAARLSLAAAFLVPAPGRAAELPAQSKITAVTVYSDRAWITRSASVDLPAGETTVVFENLPPGLFEDSASAAVRSGSARILGLELQRKYSNEPREAKTRELTKELEGLDDKAAEVRERIEVARKQLEFADKLQFFQADKASKELSIKEAKPGEWDGVLKFIGRVELEQRAAVRRAEIETREIGRLIAAKRGELAQVNAANASQSLSVSLRVSAKEAGPAVVELRYLIGGATWRPSYDARADVAAREIELTYYGTVTQSTGEDWTGVKMSLSTAKPSIGAQMTELSPIYLTPGAVLPSLQENDEDRRFSRAKKAGLGSMNQMMNGGAGAGGALADMAPAASAPAAPPPNAGWETAAAQTEGPAALYEVAGVISVPSGERPQRATISVDRFKAELSYIAAPKAQPYAFLKASVRNQTQNQLLPGPVNVFLAGNFIGQASLNSIAPQQEFPLHLGIDNRLKIKRELLTDKSHDSMWGKKLVLAQSFRITVENYTGQPQTALIYDQIPVSRDGSIEVRHFKAELPPTATKDETGELSWKLDLPQGAKRVIEFGYEVVFPEEIISQPGARELLHQYQNAL
jgi:uncharacterized protein (TIGR02231 family)